MNTRLPNRLKSSKIRYDSVRLRDPYVTKSPLYKLPHRPLSFFPKIAISRPRKARFLISPEFRRHQTRRQVQGLPEPPFSA
jgi:hypothetical protein